MFRFFLTLSTMLVCGIICLFAAMALLVTWGVAVADHEDFFSPGSDASTLGSSILGGLILLAAAVVGIGGPLWLSLRAKR